MKPCDGLIGLREDELVRRLGEPGTRRIIGSNAWFVFPAPDVTLRVRCSGGPTSRVASWTATFAAGHARLRDAARALGLWPAAAPDEDANSVDAPLVRRPLPVSGSDSVHSLTATIRDGVITQISVFDEPPDWL